MGESTPSRSVMRRMDEMGEVIELAESKDKPTLREIMERMAAERNKPKDKK